MGCEKNVLNQGYSYPQCLPPLSPPLSTGWDADVALSCLAMRASSLGQQDNEDPDTRAHLLCSAQPRKTVIREKSNFHEVEMAVTWVLSSGWTCI